MAIVVVLIHLAFTLHRRNVYICVVAIPYIRAMQTGSENRSARALASKKKAACEIVNRRMGYCMKRIEVDLYVNAFGKSRPKSWNGRKKGEKKICKRR